MQTPLILISILGLALATPIQLMRIEEALLNQDAVVRNSALENLLVGLIEDLRGTMLTGSDDVPVLDPLELDHLFIGDDVLPIPGARVEVNDVTVSKLSTFVVDTLSVNTVSLFLQRYSLEFDFNVPVLEIDARHYDLAIHVAGTNIFGAGDGKIDIIKPRFKGSLLLAPRLSIGSGLHLNILECNVQFELGGFESQINGLFNDDSLAAFINTFLKHFVPDLVKLYEDDINKVLSETVKDVGNDILADINLGGILG
ncbi:uncharacterized protein LOC113492928 [Trichoplusia ni]|uniref:Uncharacterized protein LOC113492928 n=1 Tax=Trichoplusia ni TaxID=7111 RepID=A0A7E5VDY9_TRINI|nr:uncharacterized protein LOC113492928 [Trichoplusia ni]